MKVNYSLIIFIDIFFQVIDYFNLNFDCSFSSLDFGGSSKKVIGNRIRGIFLLFVFLTIFIIILFIFEFWVFRRILTIFIVRVHVFSANTLNTILHYKRYTSNHVQTRLKEFLNLLVFRYKSLQKLQLNEQIFNRIKILEIKNSIKNCILNLICFHFSYSRNKTSYLKFVGYYFTNGWRNTLGYLIDSKFKFSLLVVC